MLEGQPQWMPEEKLAQPFVEQRGPFQVVNRRIIHDQFGMQLIADQVINPDGSQSEQFWVKFLREAVLLFPLDDQGNIYLAEEFTYATGQYSLEAVGGSIEEGEDMEEAARREAEEELGLQVEALSYLGALRELTSRINNTSHLYLARVRAVGEAHPDSGEAISLRRIPFDQAVQMVWDNKISTATIACGILRIKLLLESFGNAAR